MMFLLGKKKKDSRAAARARDDRPTLSAPQVEHLEAKIRISAAVETHIGTRDSQQDAAFATETWQGGTQEEFRVFGILCDGMGGLSDGDRASALATEFFANYLMAAPADAAMPELLACGARDVDAHIAQELGGAQGAGTTLVVAVFSPAGLHWLSVGDSRVYVLRGGEMLQVTRDHNYALHLDQKVLRGEIDAELAENHPERGALISYIGMDGVELMDIPPQGLPLLDEDMVLLCSDGLYRALTDEQMREIMVKNAEDVKKAAKKLVSRAVEGKASGQDNTTAVILKYQILE